LNSKEFYVARNVLYALMCIAFLVQKNWLFASLAVFGIVIEGVIPKIVSAKKSGREDG
jgi:uncharacterized membrane protein YesL